MITAPVVAVAAAEEAAEGAAIGAEALRDGGTDDEAESRLSVKLDLFAPSLSHFQSKAFKIKVINLTLSGNFLNQLDTANFTGWGGSEVRRDVDILEAVVVVAR